VLDLHSDTTEALMNTTALTLAYNEEPHRDGYDRGREAVQLLASVCEGRLQPTRARVRVPMLLPAINMATDDGPMRGLHALRAELESQDGVVDISIHAGFYAADQSESGFSVLATVSDDDEQRAHALAMEVATAAWQRRAEFLLELVTAKAGVAHALAAGQPIALVDEADDPAGGASCESVAILRAMLEGGVTSGGVSTICDAEVAAEAESAGVGATVRVSLGAKTDSLHGEPLDITATVAAISRERLPYDSWSGGTADAGVVAVLDVRGVLVIVTERKFIR
jgi:microcystin degradation protein MlrC